jgi:3-oxoacyl-[acyl-carrier protein] reductase
MKGKWALVRGAGRGYGREVALYLAKQGANVIVHSLELAHTKELVEEIKAHGVESYSVEGRLSNDHDILHFHQNVLGNKKVDFVF